MVNILMELYMSAGEFETAVNLLNNNKLPIFKANQELPLDILVNTGICLAYLNKLQEAKVGRKLSEWDDSVEIL